MVQYHAFGLGRMIPNLKIALLIRKTANRALNDPVSTQGGIFQTTLLPELSGATRRCD